MQAYGNWVIMQYEIAYDPSVSSSSYPGLALNWWSKTINISDVKIAGGLTGTIRSDITNPGPYNIVSTITSVGTATLTSFASTEVLNLFTGAPMTVQQEAFRNNALNAVNNLKTGIVKGFFSGITGGSSTSSEPVNFKLKADIEMAGSITNTTGLMQCRTIYFNTFKRMNTILF